MPCMLSWAIISRCLSNGSQIGHHPNSFWTFPMPHLVTMIYQKRKNVRTDFAAKQTKLNDASCATHPGYFLVITIAVRRNTTLKVHCIRLWMCKNEFMNVCADTSGARKNDFQRKPDKSQTNSLWIEGKMLFLITWTLTTVNEESTIPQFI